MSRLPLWLAAAVGVALVAAGAVLADNSNKEKIRRTPAGNARARAEVLLRADVGKGWSGGFKKPDLNSTLPCAYHPKQSDLVVVGAAETRWDRPIASEIGSEAQVLRTAAMVRKDWRRTVTAPQVVPCLLRAFKKSLGSHGKVVSFGVVPFPRLATYTRAFRVRAKVNTGSGSVPMESYFVALGAGRDELSLSNAAIGPDRASLRANTLRLARILAHRLHS